VRGAAHDHRDGQFDHRALVYDDVGAVVDEVTRTIVDQLEGGRAVLLCVTEPIASRIASRVASRVESDARLHVVDQSDRYTRPIDAVRVLWRFTRDQLDAGATRVHAIGELRFTGAPSDDDWLWYEAACNDVLGELALTATCLYDTQTCPRSALATVHATHDVVAVDGAALPTDRAIPPAALTPPPLPPRRADVELTGLSASHPVRAVLRGDRRLDADVVERANLVFSELVANAARHGGGAADVELWFDGGAVTGRVTDHGAGIADPFATLRTPQFGERGVGLWLSNIEATRLVVAPHWPSGTRATALVSPR
jgi:anti-sigma regulatory factor (Ser/Thr protein kinase)